MGRTKYTEAERNQIMTTFIRAARVLIDQDGIDNVSIRKIATLTGLNSATMYLYFPNSDVLVTMASMSYLEEYCRTLAADMTKMKTPREALLHSWDVFCQYAFERPDIFYHIFYTKHAVPLSEIVDVYYRLYPEQLQNISGAVEEMLHAGSMEERSWSVFWPAAKDAGLSKKDARVGNAMTVSFFRTLLEARRENDERLSESVQMSDRMNKALKLVLTA